jgi:hypothetical protein
MASIQYQDCQVLPLENGGGGIWQNGKAVITNRKGTL